MDAESHLRECLAHAHHEFGQPEQIVIRGGLAFDHEWETLEVQAWPLGAVSPHFVDQGAAELFSAAVIACRDPLGDEYQWLVPHLEEVTKLNRSVLVVAPKIRGLTRQILVVNNARNILHVIAADAGAESHDGGAETLDRLRELTKARWITSDVALSAEHFGQIQRVLVDARSFVVPVGPGQPIDASRSLCRALVFHVGGESSDEIKQLIPLGRRLAAEILSNQAR